MLLLRAFIQRSLAAYFQRPSTPVGALATPLSLSSLAGEPAYRAAVRAAYDALGTAWLTPSELLTPHYGRALAQWIYRDWQQHGGGGPLHIVEVSQVDGWVYFWSLPTVCVASLCRQGILCCITTITYHAHSFIHAVSTLCTPRTTIITNAFPAHSPPHTIGITSTLCSDHHSAHFNSCIPRLPFTKCVFLYVCTLLSAHCSFAPLPYVLCVCNFATNTLFPAFGTFPALCGQVSLFFLQHAVSLTHFLHIPRDTPLTLVLS